MLEGIVSDYHRLLYKYFQNITVIIYKGWIFFICWLNFSSLPLNTNYSFIISLSLVCFLRFSMSLFSCVNVFKDKIVPFKMLHLMSRDKKSICHKWMTSRELKMLKELYIAKYKKKNIVRTWNSNKDGTYIW